ncbi:VOC family protein [Streptomyces ochraceiscleroticus]|uniref:VOC family protein n=1 Tax=Streptomyces ochraceiscleroticus TaxID=47761 RepID=A0ABW1MDY9_9ACTN|nr:VOC family protein [Streptomyces ochraceiscleroticus]
MAVELNHTIVHASDREKSAKFLADILGLKVQPEFGPFLPVVMDNGVTLDFAQDSGEITPQHYAFLISEDEFTRSFDRIKGLGLAYWADPHRTRPGEINTNDGGRGVYFPDPDGHYMELITRPYGSGS